MSVILALLSSALWGVSDFLGGTASRRLPSTTVVALSQTVALVVLVPLAALLGARPTSLSAGCVAGLVGVIALGAFFAGLARGTMGVVAPIAAAGAVVPVVVGLLRGENPGAVHWVGISVVLAGVVLASGPELSGGASPVPLLLALVAAVGFGTVITLVAKGAEGPAGGVVVTMLLMRVVGVGVLLPVTLVRREAGVPRSAWLALVPIGLFDVGANTTFAFASRGHLLSVVAVLSSLYPVVTVLLARRFHAERLVRVQVAGVVATLSGVVLLSV